MILSSPDLSIVIYNRWKKKLLIVSFVEFTYQNGAGVPKFYSPSFVGIGVKTFYPVVGCVVFSTTVTKSSVVFYLLVVEKTT